MRDDLSHVLLLFRLLWLAREGWEETKRRCIWGYRCLSAPMKKIVQDTTYQDEVLTGVLRETVQETGLREKRETEAQ